MFKQREIPPCKPFFYNRKTGEKRWKPPRKKTKSSEKYHITPRLPRSPNSIFTFSSVITKNDNEDEKNEELSFDKEKSALARKQYVKYLNLIFAIMYVAYDSYGT